MTSRIIVNNIQSDTGVSSVTFGSPILAPTFIGNVNATSGVTTFTTVNIGTGTSISSPTSNTLTFGVNNVERIRVNTTGVGVGTNTISRPFEVWAGTAGTSFSVDSSGRVTKPYQPTATARNMASTLNTGGEGNYSKVVFNTSVTNRGNHYNTSTGYFTCPVAGVYYVNAFFLARALTGQTAHNVIIYKNDVSTQVKGRDIVGATGHEQCTGVTGYIDCATNDTLSIYVSNGNSGDFYNDYCYVNFSLFG